RADIRVATLRAGAPVVLTGIARHWLAGTYRSRSTLGCRPVAAVFYSPSFSRLQRLSASGDRLQAKEAGIGFPRKRPWHLRHPYTHFVATHESLRGTKQECAGPSP